ncbi:hypothetical protein Q5P01_013134 [Channa striata]|uniref:Fibronectin type-III domain-containing protein n=1 Tax=Channa striata TaxID=64152 RepID=A0AA88MMA7_CHASR|nr:hypothetical protein Q5P01_013134 [Channa striata]
MTLSLGLFLLLQLAVRAGAELVAPQNVTLITLNTNYTLSWDWHQSPGESHAVNFTVQYIGKYKLQSKKIKNWSTVCEKTSRKSCDLTPRELHYYCIYMLRVQANANGRHSDWVEKEFCPEKHAVLGPPTKVHLAPAGNDLDIFISDPLTSTNKSMKDKMSELYYYILYWEKSADTQIRTLSTSANLVTLPNLKSWTWYCVKVQSRFENKSSSFTLPHCMETKGNTPWWQIFLYFGGSVAALLLLYSCFLCYKTIKATFYPSNQLPPHLKKYLCQFPESDIPHRLTLDPESELSDKVTVCAKPTSLGIYNSPLETPLVPPSGLDSERRHTHQDSSSSGDSGVYFMGGGK